MTAELSKIPQPRLGLAMGVFVACVAALLAIRPFGGLTFDGIEDFCGVIPPFVASLYCFKAGRATRKGTGSAWVTLAAGCFAWTIGEVVWTAYTVLLNRRTPFPSVADLAYLSAYPLLFAGLQRLAAPRHSGKRVRASLDALALVAAAGTFLSAGLLSSIFADSAAGLVEKILSAAYPMLDLALLYAVLMAIPRVRESRGTLVLQIFSAGLIAIFIADIAFSFKSLDTSYDGHSFIDLGWIIGFGLLAYAASLQHQWQPSYSRSARSAPSWRPLVTLGLLPIVVVLLYFEHGDSGGAIATGLFALAFAGLVIWRQCINYQDAVRLNERLRAAYLSVSQTRAELDRQNTELVQNLAYEQERATTDGLTGVLNRHAITTALEALLSSSGGCAVGIVDIDSLKAVNDSYGHLAGDQHITCVAEALQVKGALVGRIGGDEFLVVLSDTDVITVRGYQRSVRERLVAASRQRATHPLGVSVSLGFATCPEEGTTPEELIRLADARMYVEKVARRPSELSSEPPALRIA